MLTAISIKLILYWSLLSGQALLSPEGDHFIDFDCILEEYPFSVGVVA